MADFEALIRDALSKQDANNPAVRQKVYHSSRNALQRMIAKAGNASPAAVTAQQRALENSIARVEADYAGAARTADEPVARPAPAAPQRSSQQESHVQPAPPVQPAARPAARPAPPIPVNPRREPSFEGNADSASVPPAPSVRPGQVTPSLREEPQGDLRADQLRAEIRQTQPTPREPYPSYVETEDRDYNSPPPALRRKRRWPLRLAGVLAVLLLLAFLAWLAYSAAVSMIAEYNSPASPPREAGSEAARENDTYITILEPSQTSGLVTAARGTAEVLDSQNTQIIRVQSVRAGESKDQPADPLLLELGPGVIRQIAGRRTTVEILAKSGSTGPATFAVACEFGASGDCGRKRFRVGLQPEAIVFTIKVKEGANPDQPAYLAINTDITSTSNFTGEGEPVDIYYARLRVSNAQ